MFKENTLSGKSILVTGGGTGLGFSMANLFVELGANVAICGRTKEKLDKAAKVLRRGGTKVATHQVDVRDYDAVGQMIDTLHAEFGGLNGLVNNAAGNFLALSESLSPNAFKAVVDIVLYGTFNCTQHFARNLIKEKKPGTILNIITTYTESGSSFVLPSACAKAGVYAMTTSLAFEWGPFGIRLNAIAPGLFPTEGAWSRLMPDVSLTEQTLKRIPLGRFGNHEEFSYLAAFLMSDLSSYMTGECVTIDGGERLQKGQFNFFAQSISRDKLGELFSAMRVRKNGKG